MTQCFFRRWGRELVGTLLLVAIVASGVMLVNRNRLSESYRVAATQPAAGLLADLSAAESGDTVALRRVVEAAKTRSALDDESIVLVMLRSDHPELRSAACSRIGARRLTHFAEALFPRMSDADWRVRAAAFEAMPMLFDASSHAPAAMPLRDTPVDDREPVIFQWMAAWKSPASGLPQLPELCEIYAPTKHWLTGTRLAMSCLKCHIPPSEYVLEDFARCADCHQHEHDTWGGSAHAQAYSHVNLFHVDPKTKQVAAYDYGGAKGLVCTTCHQPDTSDARGPVPAGTEALRPAHRFMPASDSCRACHADAQAQWETRRSKQRPVAVNFPPGEIDWDETSDAPSCISCHMRPNAGSAKQLDHSFAARRDARLLRDGLRARIEPATGAASPQLVLTNISGHAYPTGTIRRAIRIELIVDDDESSRALIARLTDAKLPNHIPVQPPLAPGEQRRIPLAVSAETSRITCDITYERNHFVAGSLEVPLYSISANVKRPMQLSR